jgi:spermidine synthase
MYHVVGTGLTAILFYLISYFFCRLGYYPLQFHLKVWNYLLAGTFLVTAAAGIFMALQVTYKWDVPFVKTILKWHVEFGIGMAIAGGFHFIRHFSYFKKWFDKPNYSEDIRNIKSTDRANISANLFIVGMISTSIQLLLIREIMNIAGGYELITGTFLASWLTGSALGSVIAARSSLNDIKRINLVFSLSPLVSVFLLLFLSGVFLNPGETPSFLISLIYTLLVLTPFCMVSGFTFIKLISFAVAKEQVVPGSSFSTETAGGIAAGIVISIITAGILNTYQLILITVILAVAYTILTFYISLKRIKLYVRIAVCILLTLIIIFDPDVFLRRILLPGANITESEDTPYGNISKGEYKGETSIYYNHRLLSYQNDVVEREENIHYAMLQCQSPEKVIIISGPLASQLPELMKYPVKKIIYIERDPALTKSEDFPSNSLKTDLVISNDDAFRYIRNNVEPVDAILLLVPPPSTLLLNRYYTTEFFADIKKSLNQGGVFMCSPGQYDNYLNKESVNLYSSVFNSLSSVFKNVIPVTGNKLYFIASDKELSSSVCQLTGIRNITNTYVNADFLSDDLINKKSEDVLSLMDKGIRQNSASFPVACFHFQSYNFSRDFTEKAPSVVLLLALFAVPVTMVKRRNMIMYSCASALAGFEIISLMMMQLMIGNLYQLTGLLISGLMAGLAIGSGLNIKIINSIPVRIKSIFLICFYIFFGFIFNLILEIGNDLPAIIILIVSAFLPALLTGNIFRNLTTDDHNFSITPSIYGADLAGSAFGFIFLSGFAIPAFGIKTSVFLLSLLIFTGLLFGTIKNK